MSIVYVWKLSVNIGQKTMQNYKLISEFRQVKLPVGQRTVRIDAVR